MSVIFPKWMNVLPTVAAVGTLLGGVTVVGGFWYYATPKFYRVGYMPTQPAGGFNHQIHAGKLGMDCRYCHTKIEQSAEANIPNVATCFGCHQDGNLTLQSAEPNGPHAQKTQFVREAYAKDSTIEWRRVHKVPDYVRNFPHSVHLNAGVSCFSCHGRIDTMPVVFQSEALSMSWCLDCHRDPASALVPKDKVTDLQWVHDQITQRAAGDAAANASAQQLLDSLLQTPPQNCGACHY